MLPGKLFDFICRVRRSVSLKTAASVSPGVFSSPEQRRILSASPSQDRHLPEVVTSVNIHLPLATSNHCSSHTCLLQTDWNKTSMEKHESSQSSFLFHIQYFLSVATLDHFQSPALTPRWQSWPLQTALAWIASSGLAYWEILAWGWGASASSLLQHWQRCSRSWGFGAAAWLAGSTVCRKPREPGCSPRWQRLHRRSSLVFAPTKGLAGSRPASGAAGPPCWPAGLLGARWRHRHEQRADATDRWGQSCAGLSQSKPAPQHQPTGQSRWYGQVDWCRYLSSGRENKRGGWLKHSSTHLLKNAC